MKKATKKEFIDLILWILSIIVPVMIIFWIGGMLLQWILGLSSKDLSFFLTYGQITITLFGFTMISAIFEKNKNHSKELRKLFHLSIIFLASSISFFFLYFSSFLGILETSDSNFLIRLYILLIIISLLVAFLGFVWGIFILLQILLNHAKGV